MEQTLSTLYTATKKQFKLNLIAGEKGIDTLITWVHLIEDVSTTDFIRGNELIITTGFRYEGEKWLYDFITAIVARESKGLIINTGVYIQTIPEKIIDYCNRLNFPLFTMPWEIHLEDIMQHFINEIIQANRQVVDESAMLVNTLISQEASNSLDALRDNGYPVDSPCALIMIQPELSPDHVDDQHTFKEIAIDTKNMLHRHHARFNVVTHRQLIIVLIRQTSNDERNQHAERLMRLLKKRNPLLHIHMVCGPEATDLGTLHKSYKRCISAMKPAYLDSLGICYYDKLGIEKLIMEVEDTEILSNLSTHLLDPLIDYDKKHNANYLDTLRRYIENDGSIHAVAEETFTHRNTVNYRMKKIREMLPLDLNDGEYRFRYRMAFYIMDYLN